MDEIFAMATTVSFELVCPVQIHVLFLCLRYSNGRIKLHAFLSKTSLRYGYSTTMYFLYNIV